MLNDVINDISTAFGAVAIVILLIATYRAFRIGRALMKGVYRNRAYWIGATAVVLVLLILASGLPSSNPLVVISFVVTFIVLFVFVDNSIGVAKDADFFHRNILGWERVRKPFAVLLVASSAVTAATLSSLGSGSGNSAPVEILGVLQLFIVVGVILSWGAAALTVGARRSADQTLRRFAKMLGLTIVCLVLFFTIWIPFAPFSLTIQDLGSTISEFFFPAGAYFLYLAVMSLSPVGRVEKDVSAARNPRDSDVSAKAQP